MSPRPSSSLPDTLEVFITADGSPTLALKRTDGYSEKMHHSAGALSESFYIYHQALLELIKRGGPARVLSLGLGLGYNELLAVGEFAKSGVGDWKLWSFEARDDLRQGFRQWVMSDLDPASALGEVFAQVLTRVAGRLGLPTDELRVAMHQGLRTGQLELRSAFPRDNLGVEGCSCIFYDAFSKKMDPDLWEENELHKSLEKVSAAHCVLATYAATGALNRVLRSLGFKLESRAGFEGKRESTFAIRGFN